MSRLIDADELLNFIAITVGENAHASIKPIVDALAEKPPSPQPTGDDLISRKAVIELARGWFMPGNLPVIESQINSLPSHSGGEKPKEPEPTLESLINKVFRYPNGYWYGDIKDINVGDLHDLLRAISRKLTQLENRG
mgnify:CR=1 FL=1